MLTGLGRVLRHGFVLCMPLCTIVAVLATSASGMERTRAPGVTTAREDVLGNLLGSRPSSLQQATRTEEVPGAGRAHARALAAVSADPSVSGQWSAVLSWPVVSVHMALLPGSGKVIAFTDGSAAIVWDPKTGSFKSVPTGGTNVFCAGQTALADGKILVVGGQTANEGPGPGTTAVNAFDPFTETWTRVANMTYRRWYPTATALPDGRVLATSGNAECFSCPVPIPEAYDPIANVWAQLSSASANIPVYPFMFVLPDGRVLQAGASEVPTTTQVLDVARQSWTTVDSRVLDGGSAVMYQPGKIMKAGSAADEGDPADPSAATTYVLDMTQPAPAWRQTASMAFGRAFLDLTSLPDGKVLATGGSLTKDGLTPANAVLSAELWSPSSETWTTMAAMQTPRLYHSTALLLPDGRVLVSGGGRSQAGDELNAELYSPPYLFKGPRPTITNAPTTLDYGSNFVVQTPDAANIAAVSLVRTGAVTHAFDQNQRYMNLSFQKGSGSLTVDAPANANLAPPGYYMLFVLDANGVPSVAPFVRLSGSSPPPGPPDTTAPTLSLPADITTTATSGSGAVVTYTVTASDPDNPVSQLTISCSPVSGSTFPVGTTTVNCSASDPAGNSSTGSFKVTVNPQPAGGGLVGIKTVVSRPDTNTAGSAEGYRTSASITGPVGTLHLYVDSGTTATRVIVGLYSDGGTKPGNLLGSCTINSPTTGWSSCPIPALFVTSGAVYWLAVLPPSTQSGSLKYRISKNGPGPGVSASGSLSTLPASSWPIRKTYPGDAPMSAYAD